MNSADRAAGLAAVMRGESLESVTDALKADKDVVLAAVKQDGLALMYATFGLKADKEVVLAAVKQDGLALEFAAEELKADKGVVLAAVKTRGCGYATPALRYATFGLKADKEVVLAAVKQRGSAIQFAAKELKADKLLRRLSQLSGRGRRNWHVFKLKFAIRALIAYWSQLGYEAHFDEEGEAVMQGRGARAAKRSYEEMMEAQG